MITYSLVQSLNGGDPYWFKLLNVSRSHFLLPVHKTRDITAELQTEQELNRLFFILSGYWYDPQCIGFLTCHPVHSVTLIEINISHTVPSLLFTSTVEVGCGGKTPWNPHFLCGPWTRSEGPIMFFSQPHETNVYYIFISRRDRGWYRFTWHISKKASKY